MTDSAIRAMLDAVPIAGVKPGNSKEEAERFATRLIRFADKQIADTPEATNLAHEAGRILARAGNGDTPTVKFFQGIADGIKFAERTRFTKADHLLHFYILEEIPKQRPNGQARFEIKKLNFTSAGENSSKKLFTAPLANSGFFIEAEYQAGQVSSFIVKNSSDNTVLFSDQELPKLFDKLLEGGPAEWARYIKYSLHRQLHEAGLVTERPHAQRNPSDSIKGLLTSLPTPPTSPDLPAPFIQLLPWYRTPR